MSKPALRWLFPLMMLLCTMVASADDAPAPVWIDVRTPAEYAEEHLERAILIPYDGIEAGVAGLDLGRDTPIYVYCGSGRRAGLARERLEALGYSDVTNVGSLEDARKRVAEQGD